MGEVLSHHNQIYPDFDEKDLEQIKKMASFGLTQEQIADLFGMSRRNFQKRLAKKPEVRAAYDKGVAQAILDVSENAYQMAVSGEHPSMTMFWLKCRAKWKETQRHEIHAKTTIEDLVNGAAQLDKPRDVTPGKDEDE